MAAVSPVGRAAGLEPLDLAADAHAAGALFEVHSRKVFAYCLSKLGRREDAEDAVQTTFLHAVRGLRRGVVPAVELAWLLGIARNVCLSRHESAGRRGRLELVCDPVDLERAAARPGRSEELIGLEDALAQLPEQQRRAVLLRDWRGLAYDEVARELGVTRANAETLIFRGRRSLAALLQEQPSATRRRLASLANTGSLFTAVKTAFTGAAAATKIAAAVTVVAVSGAGVAVGTSALDRGGSAPPAPPVVSIPSTGTPAGPAGTAPAPGVGVRPRTTAPASASAPAQRVAPRPAPAAPGTPAPVNPPAADPAATPSAEAPAASPRPAPATTPTVAVPRPASLPPVEQPATVGEVLDELPVQTPPLPLPEAVESLPVPQLPVETPPVVETVVGALPTVTVSTPLLPVEPVTIEPRTLLP